MKNQHSNVHEIILQSKILCAFKPGEYLHIELCGEVSKFPSVSNNRLNMIPKNGMLNACRQLTGNPSPQNLNILFQKIKSLRAISIINPEHQNILDAATTLWNRAKPPGFVTFPSTIDDRLFGILLCGVKLRQHDTHNIIKAMCDWLQFNEIIKNDRHIDIVSARTGDFISNSSSTHFVVVRQKYAFTSLSKLINLCVNYE